MVIKSMKDAGYAVAGSVVEGQALARVVETVAGVDFDLNVDSKSSIRKDFNEGAYLRWNEINGHTLPKIEGIQFTTAYVMSVSLRELSKAKKDEEKKAVVEWRKKIGDFASDSWRNVCKSYTRLPEVRLRRPHKAMPAKSARERIATRLDETREILENTSPDETFDNPHEVLAAFIAFRKKYKI